MATQVDYSKLWWVTLLAGVIAAVVNVVLYFLAQAVGFVGDIVPSIMDAATAPPFPVAIVASSIIFIAIGGAVVWVVDRFSETPMTLWRNIAIVALVLSFAQPFFAFSGNDLILLEVMHVVAGVIAIYMITTMASTTEKSKV